MAKKTRDTLDKRIAGVAGEKKELKKQHLVMYGQESLPSRIYFLVQEWSLVLQLRANPKLQAMALEMQKRFQAANPNIKPEPSNLERAQENGMIFLRDAMLRWDANAFIELGEEMKRIASTPDEYDRKKHIRVLLSAGWSAYATAKMIAESDIARGRIVGKNHFENVEDTVNEVKKRCKFKTTQRKIRPRKGDN